MSLKNKCMCVWRNTLCSLIVVENVFCSYAVEQLTTTFILHPGNAFYADTALFASVTSLGLHLK